LARHGIPCPTITGACTGTFEFEATSGAYTELQCGSYIFIDADYGRNLDHDGAPTQAFQPSLFVWATVMSRPAAVRAVVDAGLKALAFDSGPPLVCDEPAATYERASDEHRRLAVSLRPDRQPLRPSGSRPGFRIPISVVLCWRRQPPRRSRQQLPSAVLFLPDLHDADFGIGDFAVELAFRDPKVSHDGVVPDDLDREFGPFERLEGGLSRHHPVDEFGLVLEPSVRMAVAQLFRSERLYLRFVLFEPGHPQLLNGIFYRRFISRLGVCGSDQGRPAERERACGGEVTT
jgi:putative serine dehydratase-like protein